MICNYSQLLASALMQFHQEKQNLRITIVTHRFCLQCVALTKKMQHQSIVAQGFCSFLDLENQHPAPRNFIFPEETNNVLSLHPVLVAFSPADNAYNA